VRVAKLFGLDKLESGAYLHLLCRTMYRISTRRLRSLFIPRRPPFPSWLKKELFYLSHSRSGDGGWDRWCRWIGANRDAGIEAVRISKQGPVQQRAQHDDLCGRPSLVSTAKLSAIQERTGFILAMECGVPVVSRDCHWHALPDADKGRFAIKARSCDCGFFIRRLSRRISGAASV